VNKEIKGQLASRSDSVCYRFYSSLIAVTTGQFSPKSSSEAFRGRYGVFVQHNLSRPGAMNYNGGCATASSIRLEGSIRRIIIDYR